MLPPNFCPILPQSQEINEAEGAAGDPGTQDTSNDDLDSSAVAEDPKFDGHLQRKQEFDNEGKKSSNRFDMQHTWFGYKYRAQNMQII